MVSKKVLISPLNWGLGHATRDVEIIHHLLKANCEVIIGADKAPMLFLHEHFPNLECIVIPSKTIKYPRKGFMVLKMLLAAPKLLWGIYKEHQFLKKLIKKHKIDLVISDNRYGLWNKKVHSVFITHQLWIKAPKKLQFLEPIINKINHWFINKYDECWVPDFEGENNLAGELSHPKKLPKNIKYIDVLSRFKPQIIKDLKDPKKPVKSVKNFDILAILSGPEPQRAIFENILVGQILKTDYNALIVQGKPGKKTSTSLKNISFVNHLSSYLLYEKIINTKYIICRSGYSSIMDLVVLSKEAILISTPGQTEQEYLADFLSQKSWFYSEKQNNFNLEKAIFDSKNNKPCKLISEVSLLEEMISSMKFNIKR